MTTALTTRSGFAPQTLTEAMEFSKLLAESTMVPRQYQGKPQDVLVCVQWGFEMGLQPMQALQNIAVINGKPSVYGDAAMALVQASPVCEDIEEYFEGEGTPNPVAVCVAKRKNRKPVVARFSVEDAKRAGLWGKQGPWSSYPKRMMQMRARGFALRDAFPDVLKGLITVEEAQDYPTEAAPKNITPKGNPLDAVAAPETVDNYVDNVVQLPMSEPVDNSFDNANEDAMVAAAEDAEDVAIHEPAADEAALEAIEDKEYWPLVVPGKDDIVYNSFTDWQKAYEELANKVAANGRVTPETKLEKLKSLHDGNKFCLDKLSPQIKVEFIKRASVRRDHIMGG
jgi:hypothetical protein